MTTVYFHVEVEECLYDEVADANPEMEARLEDETIEYVSSLFKQPVTRHGRRGTDGALICSFKTSNLGAVRATIRDNLLTEGNDQIVSGTEYVIVRDFETYDLTRHRPLLK